MLTFNSFHFLPISWLRTGVVIFEDVEPLYALVLLVGLHQFDFFFNLLPRSPIMRAALIPGVAALF